jgi:hypothetical protein
MPPSVQGMSGLEATPERPDWGGADGSEGALAVQAARLIRWNRPSIPSPGVSEDARWWGGRRLRRWRVKACRVAGEGVPGGVTA